MNCTGNGAEDVETFDHFDLMDEALGSLDSSILKYVAATYAFRTEDEPTESQQSSDVSAQPVVLGSPAGSGRASTLGGLQSPSA